MTVVGGAILGGSQRRWGMVWNGGGWFSISRVGVGSREGSEVCGRG